MDTLSSLHTVLQTLQRRRAKIEQSGDIAPPHIWLEFFSVKGTKYIRLRSDREHELLNGKRARSLGRPGNSEHQVWEAKINRRNAILEIDRRIAMVQQLIDAEENRPVWEPEAA